MRPSNSIFNSANLVLCNSIFNGNFTLKSGIKTNSKDLRFSQFSACTTFSSVGSSMFSSIKLIAFCSIPPQIFKTIIPRITIIVATLKTFWPYPNKSSQNQCVGSNNKGFSIFRNIHKRAVIFFIKCVFFYAPSFYRFNISIIRNYIKTFKSNNRQPIFHLNPLMSDTGIIT